MSEIANELETAGTTLAVFLCLRSFYGDVDQCPSIRLTFRLFVVNYPDVDDIDRKICGLLQVNARTSSAELAEAVGLSVSSANERVRRLVAQGVVTGWQARLDPEIVGAGLCALIFIDMDYDGEREACAALVARPEVMDLHHVSGAHSYLMKIRVRNSRALQAFLQDVLKPLPAVQRTETLLSLDALKETLAVPIAGLDTEVGGD